MKKFLVLLSLAFILTACSNESVPITSDNNIDNLKPDEEDSNINEEDTIDTNEEDTIDSEDLNSESDNSDESVNINKDIDYELIKPNEIGQIMVVMYHGISDNPPYQRTQENFRKDLQFMYDNGYRLISMSDFINNNINVEAGLTPIVLTFDDGLKTTFSLEEINGELKPKSGTAISIIEEFSKEHPDFGKAAILYINGGEESTFSGEGTYQERLQWLIDNGYEIGNHLRSHPNLSNKNSEQIQMEIGTVDQMVKNAIVDYKLDSLSYPFGVLPDDIYMEYIEKGIYNNQEYNYCIAFREAFRQPMVPIIHIEFQPMICSRTRGSEGEYGDLWWFFEYYENNPEYRYISDGMVDRISVPKESEDQVNKEKIGDSELYLY